MKKGIKKQLLTGIAAVALVAPLVLGGFNSNAHAATTPLMTSASANASAQSTQGGTQSSSQSAQPSQGTGAAQAGQNDQSSNGQSKKAISMQQLKQMMAKQQQQMMAKQKQQLAKQMKGSTQIFLLKGHEIYTAQAKGSQMFPTTLKKYMPLKQFRQAAKPKIAQLQRAIVRYRATRNKKYLKRIQKNAKYVRIARMPNTKQQAQTQKRSAKTANKNSQNAKSTKQTTGLTKRHAKKARRHASKRTHESGLSAVVSAHHHHARKHRRARKARRTRLTNRIQRSSRKARKHSVKRSRRSATTFVNDKGETLLKSEYRRGNNRQAKRARFAKGPTLDNVPTFFNRYKPNDRRAVIPKSYQIKPNDTTWLVGKKTRNIAKINHIKDAYYYNQQYKGWSNIGYKG